MHLKGEKMEPPQEENQKKVFVNFHEYWHFAKCLTASQRDSVFESLPDYEQIRIRRSFTRGGWIDLMMRDTLDRLVDELYEKCKYNLIELRGKVLKGKSVYLPREIWDYFEYELEGIEPRHKAHLVGGIHAVVCKQNKKVVLLLPIGRED